MASKLLTFITGRLNPGIIESMHGPNQSNKQSSNQTSKKNDQTFISILDYP